MELRQLYKQGKSIVLVIPSKYLKVLEWENKDQIAISIMPDKSLKLSKAEWKMSLTILNKES